MASRLAIYHPPGGLTLQANPFGKDVANLELYRALAQHGGFEQIDVLSGQVLSEAQLAEGLLAGGSSSTQLRGALVADPGPPIAAGALLRGQPDLFDLAWMRRRAGGDRAYSLLGLTHTLGPPAMRQLISMASVAPVQPWDAIICTSPSVRDVTRTMLDEWGAFLAERTGGSPPPPPALPIVPLGVTAHAFESAAARPAVRAARRAALGVGDGEILALWVGRLSFFEKAFPQPMFLALQRAAAATGVKLTFAMAGWFPSEQDRGRYEVAARAHAPDVAVHFLDGNDRALLEELWAAGDIFLSLVDNIQETFGITPLEAMAAGMPVVASDWDGYRYTLRDGIEGFLVPTLGGPAGNFGHTLNQRHVLQLENYQTYVGAVAQHTAVNVERAAQAIAALIGDPELRRRMGAAGQARVRTMFDWPVVAKAYQTLLDELAEIRTGSAQPASRFPGNPVKGDPFAEFAGFASQVLRHDLRLSARPGATAAEILAMTNDLDRAFRGWRIGLEDCVRVLDLVASGRAGTVGEVVAAFPAPHRHGVELGIMWMAKLGILDWPT